MPIFSARQEFDEIASDANWVSLPVSKSLYYVTPGPLVRPRQWPQRPYGQWRSDFEPPCCFGLASEQFQSEISTALQMCQAAVDARRHLLLTPWWLIVATLYVTDKPQRRDIRAFSHFTVFLFPCQRKWLRAFHFWAFEFQNIFPILRKRQVNPNIGYIFKRCEMTHWISSLTKKSHRIPGIIWFDEGWHFGLDELQDSFLCHWHFEN